MLTFLHISAKESKLADKSAEIRNVPAKKSWALRNNLNAAAGDMGNRTVPSNFLKSVLQNGAGRYVCQLQRLTLCFCKSDAGSRGMRSAKLSYFLGWNLS